VKAKPAKLKGKHTKPNVWDRYRKPILIRTPGAPGAPFQSPDEKLDPGVNIFVLILEQMGLTTRFSCEGHPDGFYISFKSNYKTAIRIRQAGYFTVEIEGKNFWSIRVHERFDRKNNKREHVDRLRWAAAAWVERFGEPKSKSKPKPKRPAGLSPAGKP
jgi:hypothetical protein